jgi:AcrR family transcriptional regulator
LTRDRIERAALAIVDRDGVEALSRRRLGAELGVEAMSVYYYVPGKDALLDRVAARVAGEVRVELADGTAWRPALHALGDALRATLRAHPRAVTVVATRPLDPEAGRRFIAPVFGPLLEGGFDEERALLAIQSVAVFTVGHALAETGAGQDADDAAQPDGPTREGTAAYYDRWFALGLGALVDGLAPISPASDDQQHGRNRTASPASRRTR